jgi:hypothetical protein
MHTEDYDDFLQEAVLELHAEWGERGGRDLTEVELQELNTLLDNFFGGKRETLEQSVKRCSDELIATGEASFMGRTIKPAPDQMYTVISHANKYSSIRAACCAIKKERRNV